MSIGTTACQPHRFLPVEVGITVILFQTARFVSVAFPVGTPLRSPGIIICRDTVINTFVAGGGGGGGRGGGGGNCTCYCFVSLPTTRRSHGFFGSFVCGWCYVRSYLPRLKESTQN